MTLPGTLSGKLIAAAVAAAVLFAAGCVVGWMVNGWRLGARITVAEAKVSAYEGANKRCTASVGEVKESVAEMVRQADERAKAAAEALKRAQASMQRYIDASKAALERPMPKRGEECATAAREAREYAERRRKERK